MPQLELPINSGIGFNPCLVGGATLRPYVPSVTIDDVKLFDH